MVQEPNIIKSSALKEDQSKTNVQVVVQDLISYGDDIIIDPEWPI